MLSTRSISASTSRTHGLADEAEPHQDLAEALVLLLLLGQRDAQLVAVDEPLLDQELAELLARRAPLVRAALRASAQRAGLLEMGVAMAVSPAGRRAASRARAVAGVELLAARGEIEGALVVARGRLPTGPAGPGSRPG